jgi:hypothetical protein
MFKPLDEVLRPDERHAYFRTPAGNVATLAHHYRDVAVITLTAGTPDSVRQVFDRGRNAYLYSWFDYELGAAAEMLVFSALELGLRHRFGIENEERSPGLVQLYRRAVSECIFDPDPPGNRNEMALLAGHVRNTWAHGSTHVHDPGSVVGIIRMCAKHINKLFPVLATKPPDVAPVQT